MSFSMLFGLFGGLGLFIYGMRMMSEGLQKAAGKKLKQLLGMLTTNRFAGLGVGTLVTAIIQSSSATTVMVVGFVNAGLMTLSQSIGVIMGANIGTTITAQLIAFNLSHYSFHAIAIGAGLFLFSKKDRTRQIGQVVLGFGILFLGLNTMQTTMAPLRDLQIFMDLMERFSRSPLLGLLLGTVLTITLQSSSASIGILIGLLSVGAIDYWGAVPILLGDNIGTTITALLSSVGANKTAKRAAAAHFTFNLMGSAIVVALFYIIPNFAEIVHSVVSSTTMAFQNLTVLLFNANAEQPSAIRMIANTHTLFNILNTVVWLPFMSVLATIATKIIPGEDKSIKRGLTFLDERMLETPTVAINQLKAEILRMYDISADMVKDCISAFKKKDVDLVKSIRHKEDVINELEEELLTFLTRFPRNTMSETDVHTVDMYYALIDDVESIGDDAHSIAELAVYRKENEIEFSDRAWETLGKNFSLITKLLVDTRELIETKNLDLVEGILEGERQMDIYQIEHRNGHMKRLGKGLCDPNAGIVFVEVLDDLEHISDQMGDISHSIMEAKEKKV